MIIISAPLVGILLFLFFVSPDQVSDDIDGICRMFRRDPHKGTYYCEVCRTHHPYGYKADPADIDAAERELASNSMGYNAEYNKRFLRAHKPGYKSY